MIYKLDHIGITVRSLTEAQQQIEGIHPRFHAQHGIEAREALREVSLHKPDRLSISLHRRNKDIGIELIEYPRVSQKRGSMLPWRYDPEGDLETLKEAIREQIDRSLNGWSFADVASLLLGDLNAVVVPVEDLAAEERFWEGLRFRKIRSDGELSILGLRSLIPPARDDYIVLLQVDFAIEYHTDVEGLNEIALLCHSCSTDLRAFPQDVFKSTVGRFSVDGKEIDLGYLRSPSGVLAELMSVRFP